MISPAVPGKALVTGATGFIGAHLVSRLVADGWQVDVIVRPTSDRSRLGSHAAHVSFQHYTETAGCMLEILQKSRPNVVFHLASHFLAQHQPQDVPALVRSNIQFGAELLEAMVAQGVTHFINTGTAWQHFQNEAYNPVCLYAATKQAFEDILRYYTAATPLRAITLKLFDTIGPDDRRQKLVHLLLQRARDGRRLELSPGEQLIDIVHVDDVVQAFLLAARRLANHADIQQETYGVSSGDPIPLREFVRLFEKVRGVKLSVAWGAQPYRDREVMRPWQAFHLLPGWSPKVPLAESLKSLS